MLKRIGAGYLRTCLLLLGFVSTAFANVRTYAPIPGHRFNADIGNFCPRSSEPLGCKPIRNCISLANYYFEDAVEMLFLVILPNQCSGRSPEPFVPYAQLWIRNRMYLPAGNPYAPVVLEYVHSDGDTTQVGELQGNDLILCTHQYKTACDLIIHRDGFITGVVVKNKGFRYRKVQQPPLQQGSFK